MFQQVHVLWRRLSPLLRCSDGCVGDTCHRICQSCPSGRHFFFFATFSSSSCRTPSLSLCRQAFTPQVTYPLGCCCDNAGHVHLLGLLHHRRVDGSRRCFCSHKSTLSAEVLHHPSTRNQTEVEVQLHLFSTVLDVVNRVLGIRRTSCTKADSESVSDCVVPSRSGRECQDL